jgi:hypothetical protein
VPIVASSKHVARFGGGVEADKLCFVGFNELGFTVGSALVVGCLVGCIAVRSFVVLSFVSVIGSSNVMFVVGFLKRRRKMSV